MPAPATFRTARLVAARLGGAHLPDLLRMDQDPAVMATLGGLRTEDETRALIARNEAHWQTHGFGIWALRDPDGGAFLGRGGLRWVEVAGANEVEVAYAFLPGAWGRGLATELARALVALAGRDLGLAEVVGFTLTTNHASRRVLAKAGLVFERAIVHADRPHVLHRWPEARPGDDGEP